MIYLYREMINKVSIKFVFGFLGILLVGFGVVITAGYLSDNKNIDPEINLANDRIQN